MSEIINLRKARKARKRADAEREAEANRAKHGRTKASRNLAAADKRRHEAAIDGARRDRDED